MEAQLNTILSPPPMKEKKGSIIWGYIIDFLKKNILTTSVTIIVLFITSPLELIVLSNLITSFTHFVEKLDYTGSINSLWKIAALFTFTDIAYMIVAYFEKINYTQLEKYIRLNLVDVMFKNIEVNYDDDNISSTILKLSQIPNFACSFTAQFAHMVLGFFITACSILIYIAYKNVELGGMMTFVFVIFCIIYYYVILKIKNKSVEKEKGEKILMTHFDDVISNSLSVLSCKKVDDEKDYLRSKHATYDKINEDNFWYSSKGYVFVSFMSTFILIIYSYIIFLFYKSKKITNSDTITIIILLLQFVRYLRVRAYHVIKFFIEYGKLEEGDTVIQDIFNSTPANGVNKNVEINGNIEFKNVYFKYSKNKNETIHPTTESLSSREKMNSLDNVSFTIKPLDRVAIIGTNGSGKSTIIKLIMGYYRVSGGQILHNGTNVQDINREYLRSNIAIISQKVVLFNRSIIDNICYGNNIPKEKVKHILKKLHVISVFKNHPQGLETLAGLHGSALSGGQKQIIYLLRCYLSNKPIIIMDEPTAAVDSINKKYIMRMIDEMAKKSTLIVVTHDSEYAASFPTKIYIDNGKIVKFKGANDSSMPYDDYNDFSL